MRAPLIFGTWVGLSAMVACGGGGSGGAGGTGGGGSGGTGGATGTPLPCEIQTFLEERCHDCHTNPPKFGAPMPLVTYEDLVAPAKSDGTKTVAERMIEKFSDPVEPMPPPPRPAASAGEIALIQGFIDQGYPEGDGNCGGAGGAGGGGNGGAGGAVGCTPNVSVAPTDAHAVGTGSEDEYVCYGFDVPADQAKRWIEAIVPRIDNETVVHHMLLLQAPTSYSGAPISCDPFPPIDWKLLYGWGPGTPPHVLPADVGFPIDAGGTAHFVMQMHYNNANALPNQTDTSGVDLCVTSEAKQHDADVLALGGTSFTLPANQTSTVDCSLPLTGQISFILPLNVFQAWPHMHKLGTKLKSEIEHSDGSTTSLGDSPAYSFNNQISYPITAQLVAGDNLRTWCTYDNNTPADVGFGENTANEMCFNFLAYYPKINFPQWNWILPAQVSQCGTYAGDPQP